MKAPTHTPSFPRKVGGPSDRGNRVRRPRGFTLVEMMIVVVIAAILAVVALPGYTLIANRAKRATGKTQLLALAQQEETFFADRKKYAPISLLTSLPGNFAYLAADGSLSASASTGSIYRLSVVQLSPGGAAGNSCSGSGTPAYDYLLIAAPMNGQNGDSRCMTLCLASTGDKGATGSDGAAACWQR